LLKQSGSRHKEESLSAVAELAKALETPLRKGIMSGDILSGIYEAVNLAPGATPEFPLDFLAPGTEKDFVAYTIPNHGRIPERHVEGDYVMVPTYDIGASIDWLLKYARDARWDVVGRAMEVMRSQFTKKMNDDGWHTLISAGVDRNILIYDDDAAASTFSKRLVSLFMSPEGIENIRNWGVDEVDDVTRRELITQEGGLLSRIFQVTLHDLDELGDGQEYENFYENDLGGTLPAGDTEIVVGLDMSRNDSFVMPVRAGLQVFEDDTLHRQRRAGFYGWAEQGFAVLDNRRVLIGSF
jgi:hypothetical protein